MAWIYDLDSETAYCLHTDPYAEYIRDYYTLASWDQSQPSSESQPSSVKPITSLA